MTEQSGTKQLLKILEEDLAQIYREQSLSEDNSTHRGEAFARWLAQLFMQDNPSLEADIDEAVLPAPGDLGIDVFLEDETNRTLTLIQAKHRGLGRKPNSVDPDTARHFLTRHEGLLDASALQYANDDARFSLISYRERIPNGWKARFYYISTAAASPQIRSDFNRKNQELDAGPYDVEFAIVDRSDLAKLYREIQSRDEAIPEHSELDVPADKFFEHAVGPYPAIVGLIKGNALRNEYRKHGRGDSLFAWNIRHYLGDRGLNKDIKNTAEEEPDNFFYYNNGVTAVCRDYQLDGNKLSIQKFQIINGAQTVATLARSHPDEDVYVLFRLIKTGRVDTDSGINAQIIEANNRQNAIRLSDFRANDSLQRWLKSALYEASNTPVLGIVTYQPKRTGKRGKGRVVTLEELAKIRYAFLVNPCLVHASPKDLWTPQSDGGAYEVAFGENGELPAKWSNAAVDETLFAITTHDKAAALTKAEKQQDSDRAYMHRLRFHVVALVGEYLRTDSYARAPSTYLNNKERFEELWDYLWPVIRRCLRNVYKQHVTNADDPMSHFALVRSERVWQELKADFSFELE